MTLNKEFLYEIAELSELAGDAILEVYESGDFQTELKADSSPLTEADLASNRVIIDGLSRLTPNIPVLSEECREVPFKERADWRTFWCVDPLDGTKEFVKRNGEFTVNIALIEEGRPVMGVVHSPVLGFTYFASERAGAFKGNRGQRDGAASISVTGSVTGSVTDGKGETLRLVASRSHRGKELDAYIEGLESLGKVEIVSMGSSLKLCLVADGSADIYPRLGPTMEWDTAAAHAVVSGAGGRVTDLSGAELSYNKPKLLNPYFIVSGSGEVPGRDYLKNLFKNSK